MKKLNTVLMRSISILLIFSFLLSFSPIIPKSNAAQTPQAICTDIAFGYVATWNDNGQWYADFGDGTAVPVSLNSNYNSHQFTFKPPVTINSSLYQSGSIYAVAQCAGNSSINNYINTVLTDTTGTYGTWEVQGGANNITRLDQIQQYYLNYEADNCNIINSSQSVNNDYSKTVQWNFNLGPVISNGSTQPIDLKSNNSSWVNQYYTPTWQNAAGFSTATQAYLWALPVVITWYGTSSETLNMGFTDFTPTVMSSLNAGTQASGYIHAENYSLYPTIPQYTQFRVYTWVQGQAPQLAYQSPGGVALDGLQTENLPFQFLVPNQPFTLICTLDEPPINLSSSWSDITGWEYDPMNVTTASGSLAEAETTYADNKAEAQFTPNTSTGGGGGGSGSSGTTNNNSYDLAGVSLNYNDTTATAVFNSTFPVSGYANVYLYSVDTEGNCSFVESSSNVKINPG